MPLAFLSLPPFPPPPPLSFNPKFRPTSFNFLLKPPLLSTTTAVSAIGPDGKYYPNPADDDPPEAPEDSMHGVNKFQQIQRQAARARKIQEEEYKKDQPIFIKALEETEDVPVSVNDDDAGDDLFGEIDKAIALKRQEFIKQGLIKPRQNKKPEPEIENVDELEPEEVVDLEEIKELHGLTQISDDEGEDGSDEKSDFEVSDGDFSNSFDIDFDEFGKTKARIVEPKFKMSLAELLDESKVVPISADKRGAVAVVASKEIDIEATLGCKALVIVEDTNMVLAALAASFFRHPSRSMSVIGITGTNGKTTTAFLIKGCSFGSEIDGKDGAQWHRGVGHGGEPNVPVVTLLSMENKNADVHPFEFDLCLRLRFWSARLKLGHLWRTLFEELKRGDAVPGRCELIDEEQAFGVIVDYAQQLMVYLDSLIMFLFYTIICKYSLLFFTIIPYLASEREIERGKRPMMTKIATDKSDVTILTSDNPKNEDPLDILDDMLAGVGWTMQDYLKHGENDYYPPLPNGHRLFLHDIRRVAVRCAVAMAEEGDMVVVAGKGHETYQIEGDKKEFFDDREECREALQYVDELHQAGIDTSEFPWRIIKVIIVTVISGSWNELDRLPESH
ncbi:UNVERIFIED_CONTAM: UDP-N-acetylmuramoyl-L-alanyl-D-glutamate--2,6-diaminopimelate ligase MurE, chloroplastic [Sesamum calycinum]|uniref:UDP-N-acetylmuramoyl-L-alanyl-D-glutamate--2, 6-diaminopimelate ligase MurE, chloroplastic n=1 Tax=Sesamum calycinum TaxID=2727403 RepID=A0AAW2QWX0_9LAMI